MSNTGTGDTGTGTLGPGTLGGTLGSRLLHLNQDSSSAVPSAVGNLRLAPYAGLKAPVGGLLVSWTPGDGDLDMYIVSLSTAVSPAADIWLRGTCP